MSSIPTIPPFRRTGRSASPVPVRKLPEAHIFQICKKQRLNAIIPSTRCTMYYIGCIKFLGTM